MKKPFLIFALIVFLVSAACSVPVQTRWSTNTPAGPVSAAQATLPQSQSSPTGLGTANPTTSTPEDVTPTTEAAGTVTQTSTSTPAPRAMPDGVVNIMVLGSDWRASSGHRTDVIMLVSINTIKETVSVVSFPRDLYVPIPGWSTQRINTAEPHGGFQMLADTMDSNFSVRPEYYIMTDFQGFKGIIDRLGGVSVYAGSKLVDKCDLPAADENGKCAITPGMHVMDGDTALWYVRSRGSSSDLDRLRREQEVLTGIFTAVMSADGVKNLTALFSTYKSSVKTNLTVQAMTPLLPTAAKVFADRKLIRKYTLTVKEAKPYKTDTGAQVLLPDYTAINKILDEAIFN